MPAKICPVCKNKFYSEDEYYEGDSLLSNHCPSRKNKKEQKLVRTSTPVVELENSPENSSNESSDSVTDFFYRSWKSGLHLDNTVSTKRTPVTSNYQPLPVLQPVCYAPNVLCVNTVIYQHFMPVSYVQQVGYRPDGTFGVLPPSFWQ